MSKVDPIRPRRAKDLVLPPHASAATASGIAGPLPPLAAPPPVVVPPAVAAPPAVSPMAPYAPPQPIGAPPFPPAPSTTPTATPPAGFPIVIQTARPSKPEAARPPAAASRAADFKKPFSLEPVALAPLAPVVLSPEAEEPPADATETAVKSAPPFLVSMFVHMFLMVLLALLTFHKEIANQLQLEAVYAESLGLQLLDNKLQSPESLDMQVEVPALSFDLTPVNDPLAAPPRLAEMSLDATKGTSNLEAPSIGLALTGREAGMKKALLPAYGGTATTEAAVLAGLEWLKRQQMRDGGWSLAGPYPDGSNSGDNRCAATAMALLAFQGYGTTHVSSGGATVDFHDVVERGWNFLLKMQNKDGQFVHDGSHNQRTYAQAQASIAICEIYGMTKDPKFKKPAQLALDYAHKAQSPELGGWRYQPRIDSDMSVTGWYVMALQSGMMAGLQVQSPSLDAISKFLDRVGVENGTQYCYQIGGQPTIAMTAEALLCRQYLGWKHDDPRMRAGIDQLLANRINYDDDQNVYYWYYATQACHHMDGDDWNRWNERMREAVPAAQTKTGSDRGSWGSHADRWGSHGGRLYVTCLSIFMLETYYRHLPIYKWRLQ